MRDKTENNTIVAIVFVLVVAFAVVYVWIAAHYEAKTYNRLTGKHATTWDAIWVELRVMDHATEAK